MGASPSLDRSPSAHEWNIFVISYAASTVAIFLKYTFSLVYASNTGNHPEEDKQFSLPPPPEDIRRRERQFSNDMENIPLQLLLFWAAFIVQNFANASGDGGRYGTLALTSLILIYTFSRIMFTACYLFGWQPWRTIFFVMASICLFITGIFLIYSAVLLDMGKVFPAVYAR